MILVDLEVDDFMKFERVRLEDLPANGLIGIRGPNEAGKTSLGDAICFALFGRTLRLPGRRRAEVIRWGTQTAAVAMTFHLSGGALLRVRRRVDTAGGYEAELSEPGSEEPIAQGPARVDAELERRLGFDFEAFRYAFFLGQKEVDLILRSSRTSGALERLLGLDALDEACARAESEGEALDEKRREVTIYLKLQRELFERFSTDSRQQVDAARDARDARDELAEQVKRVRDLETALQEAAAEAGDSHQLQALLDRVKVTALARSLAGRVAVLEQDASSQNGAVGDCKAACDESSERSHEYQMFAAALDELEASLRERAAELGSMGPRSKRLEVRRAELLNRAEGEQSLSRELIAKARTSVRGLGAVALGGVVVAVVTGSPLWMLTLPLAAAGYLAVPVIRERGRDAAARLQAARVGASELRAELDDLAARAGLCERLTVRDREALLAGLDDLGGDAACRLAERIAQRHPGFWEAPEAFLEGYGAVLEESATLRRQAYEEALRHSSISTVRAETARVRFDDVVKGSALPRVEGGAFEGVDAEEAGRDLDRDLAQAERLATRLEAYGPDGRELGRDREVLVELFEGLAPQRRGEWPDVEGIFRILRGVNPPGVGRAEDPLPWALAQEQRAVELGRADQPELEPLERELDEARGELTRLRARAELFDDRAADREVDEDAVSEKERLIHELATELESLEEEVAVRRELEDGLAATAERVRRRLLPSVSALAGELMPRITGGKHGRVRVGEDGELWVYAPEAGRDVPLEALSGGARDQLLLSLRLAFAAAVVRSRMASDARQFLFLDEPLASSDEERGLRFLELLGDRADTFRQVFVVTHRIAGDENYDLILRLTADATALEHPPATEGRLAEVV